MNRRPVGTRHYVEDSPDSRNTNYCGNMAKRTKKVPRHLSPKPKRRKVKFSTRRPEYDTPQYRTWAKDVKVRDGFKCVMPGCGRTRCKLESHHIIRWVDAPGLRYSVLNGICLCMRCHSKITGRESLYASMFTMIAYQNTLKQQNRNVGQ